MGGGKETPRQKMISMMYIVLTALLALNVSKQILDAFVAIEANIQKGALTQLDRGNELKTDLSQELASSKGEEEAAKRKKIEIALKTIADIDKECEIIRNREIITRDKQYEPVEITDNDGQIVTGPPTLTRFEKARIMGARALQLSLGAPVFIEIPKNATSSLEIAMEELKQRVIPIVIKRTLPNGDYQNIPIDQFA